MIRVSVVISAFNSASTISEALESILAQTYDKWECIVYDDASNDDTWNTINHYQDRYKGKIIGVKNAGMNKGPAHGRNCCIDLAKGEYIAIQDADDTSLPERLAKQVAFLDGRKDVSAVGTYAFLTNSTGKVWGVNKPLLKPERKDWIKGPQVIHASCMIRKRDLIAAGKYNPTLRRVEDYELWLRMIAKGYKIETMPIVLYKIRADQNDYKKRILKYRWEEVKVKYRLAKQMGLPLISYLYLLKPLLIGMFPPRWTYLYHKGKFSISEDAHKLN